MRLWAIAAFAIAAACAREASPEARSEPALNPAPIDAALNPFVDDGRAAGVSALIYKDGEEAYFGAFGMRDREAGLAMTRDAILQIQSMTKPITGVALMQLYEQGKFDLDDPIAKYAPEFANLKVFAGFDDQGGYILVEPKRPPSIRDLGRHTAGFYTRGYTSPLQDLVKAINPISSDNTLAEFAQKLGTLPLLFHPGERIVYAYATDVEAFLVERLTGQPYADFVEEHVLRPLRMNDTGYYVPEEKRNRVAIPYQRGVRAHGESFDAIFTRQPLTPGGFGLTSTIDDYMRFLLMIRNHGELDGARLLKPETVRLMGTDQLPATVTDRSWPSPDGTVGWGIDFAVRTAPPASPDMMMGVVGEMYWEGGLGTLFWIDRKNDLIAIFFVQTGEPAEALHKEFRDAVYKAIGIAFGD